MDDGITVRFTILFFLFILSAFFSASEAAYFSLSKLQLNTLPEKYGSKGERIIKLLEKPKEFLITIYIGNETVNVLISTLITSIGISLFGSIGIGVAIGIGTFLLLVFCEITPKTLAMNHAERFAVATIPFMAFFHKSVYVLQRFLLVLAKDFLALFGFKETVYDQSITEDEIKSIVDVGEDEGNIKETEKKMIKNVFELNDISVEKIATHRADITAVKEDATINEVLEILKEKRFSRFPVYKENLDNITGFLLVKDILRIKSVDENWENIKVGELMVQPYIIPETKKVDELLRDFKLKRIHIAIVADEFGVTNGMITLDDILSEILGDNEETSIDTHEDIKQLDEKTYHVYAQLEVEKFNEFFECDIPVEEFDTIGGYVFHLFGYLPEWGEKTTYKNLTIYVMEKKGFRIMKLKVVVNK